MQYVYTCEFAILSVFLPVSYDWRGNRIKEKYKEKKRKSRSCY